MHGTEVWTMNIPMKSKLLATEINAHRKCMRNSKLERLGIYYVRHKMNGFITVVDGIHQKDVMQEKG